MAPTKGELLLISCDKLSQKYILNKKIFVLPIGKKQFKVGSTFDWNDLTEAPTPQGLKILKDGLEHLISEKYKIKDYFVGIRPTIRDRRPVLGFHPTIKNFAVFNGLGAKGVMLGPYFAKQMINLLTTNNFDVNPEVKIERFIKQPGN
jgi:glycine/D-amino acid oxidase-like deaminating enzyme